MIRGSAHGKVILFGEHAVVYGIPALAVGIDRGAWAEASPLPGGVSTLHVRTWNITLSTDGDDESSPPLARAFRDLLSATRDGQRALDQAPVGTVRVDAEADLPPGGGLGCSAALGVAVARALDPLAPSEAVAARVDAWERVFHGNPSGVDAAVAAQGGCVLFQRPFPTPAEGATPLLERVRVNQAIHLCVGHSGQASSTKSMVEAVARIRERRPDVTQRTFDAIHTLVKNARLAIEDYDLRAVGQLLDLNQMLLSGLFLSTPEIEQMCAAARAAGALGAKLTGAGGGGCVVALVEDAERGAAVLGAWKSEGFDGFATLVKPEATDVHAILQKLHARVAAAGSP
jgi:mevalonate kinase